MGGTTARGGSAGRPGGRPAEREERGVRRARPPAPELPDEATADRLDADIRRDLRSLPPTLAERISRHLVAAALLLDDDPQLALAHASAASGLAPRIAAAREAFGLAAYHAGEYATALVELRAARRIDGSARHLPVMADAERGLGRPERALEYLSDPAAAELDAAGRAELLIVVSGARRDLGQPEAAVVVLQQAATASGPPQPWTPRLRYAYAEALLAADRPVDALRWFESVAAIDDGETDAADRAYMIMTGQQPPQDEDADEHDGAVADARLAGIGPDRPAAGSEPTARPEPAASSERPQLPESPDAAG
jgi:tetratricopeptide (TPR) repeat protein